MLKKFIECKKCKEIIELKKLQQNMKICPNCNYYFNMTIHERLEQLADEKSFIKEIGQDIQINESINYDGYKDKLENVRIISKLDEAVQCGICHVNNYKVMLSIMDSRFLMGSFGKCVGEKITLSIEEATKNNLPIIILSSSSGARMQEGVVSLMQMVKMSQAIAKHNEKKLLYISILTNPTMGGATASFSSLGDIILAEPNALIGFTGKRVIQQTINKDLPKDFQTSEFLLKHGFIDEIVERKKLKETLSLILEIHKREE